MKRILLTQNKFALVDNEDFNYLNQFKWYLKNGYAARAKWNKKSKNMKTIFMHRVILNTPRNICSDHIDMNRLNNQKSNLRIATYQQNACNRVKRNNLTSKFKGVDWHKTDKKWEAGIKVDNKRIHLGNFDSPIEAAIAYNLAAKKYHGEFARLNQI